MKSQLKLTGYFAGALFSAQELYGNVALANAVGDASQGAIQLDLPQDFSAQETGDGRSTRAVDYLGLLQRDFIFANMNGPELDSGTVAEYMLASMLGMPRVQFRSDFRNVGDARTPFPAEVTVCKTTDVPYNLMLGYDESALVFVNSMSLYKKTGGPEPFLRALAVAALRGIALAFSQTNIAKPEEYALQENPLVRHLNLDASQVRQILLQKRDRHLSSDYQDALKTLIRLK